MTIYLTGFLLQETGDYLLQEDGERIKLDQFLIQENDMVAKIIGSAGRALFGISHALRPKATTRITNKSDIV